MDKLGKNIKKYREALGYTQEDLAARLGYKSRSTINKIEMGINDISQSKIEEFAKVLNVTPSALMGWGEENESRINNNTLDISFFSLEKGTKISDIHPDDIAAIQAILKKYRKQ
jgi:transcriptional regulator with XRE-family HTH domain